MTLLLRTHGFDIVAAVDNGPDLLDALLTQRPDVAVVDVRLPPTNTDEGLQAALAARREIPALPVLILSQHVEQLYARELLADGAGAVGYLLKDRVLNADQFVDAVNRVADGGTVIDPEVIAKLLSPARPPPAASRRSRRASATCSRRWRRDARTRRSGRSCSSARAPWASTSRASSASWT
jgi:DNA-binding NarL/FixJ family response regulator